MKNKNDYPDYWKDWKDWNSWKDQETESYAPHIFALIMGIITGLSLII